MIKNLIDDFHKVADATNCYTVSTCHEYLRSRWSRILKNALTTTPLDWSIPQTELEGTSGLSNNDKQTPRRNYQYAPFEFHCGTGKICVQNLASGDSALPLSIGYRISPPLLILLPSVRAVMFDRTCHRQYLFTYLDHEPSIFHHRF